MANKRKLTVDKTFLSLDQAETRGFIHRDYIAHCLRWTHFVKQISRGGDYKRAVILDVGCGRELPLARLLYSSRLIPQNYIGVDAGPIEDESAAMITGGKFPCLLYEDCDFAEPEFLDEYNGKIDFITCFEVLEHVEPAHMCRMLIKMKRLLNKGGRAYLSTPCWNRTDCAANHVDEMTYGCLGSVLEDLGFQIENHYGTFASQTDYKHLLPPDVLKIWTELARYYDSNLLSCIFAPMMPAQSRNVLWEVTPVTGAFPQTRKFPVIAEQTQPLGSSGDWSRILEWWPTVYALAHS